MKTKTKLHYVAVLFLFFSFYHVIHMVTKKGYLQPSFNLNAYVAKLTMQMRLKKMKRRYELHGPKKTGLHSNE